MTAKKHALVVKHLTDSAIYLNRISPILIECINQFDKHYSNITVRMISSLTDHVTPLASTDTHDLCVFLHGIIDSFFDVAMRYRLNPLDYPFVSFAFTFADAFLILLLNPSTCSSETIVSTLPMSTVKYSFPFEKSLVPDSRSCLQKFFSCLSEHAIHALCRLLDLLARLDLDHLVKLLSYWTHDTIRGKSRTQICLDLFNACDKRTLFSPLAREMIRHVLIVLSQWIEFQMSKRFHGDSSDATMPR